MRSTGLLLMLLALLAGCGGTVTPAEDRLGDSGALPDTSTAKDSGSQYEANPSTKEGGSLPDTAPPYDSAQPIETSVLTEASVVDAPVPIPPGQKTLFDLTYRNFAWGESFDGFYVAADGNVYRYGGFEGGIPGIEFVPNMTEEQVMTKYGSAPQLVGTVDPSKLQSMFALVGAAQKGALLWQSGCADFGTWQYVGWLYDSATGRYTPVNLGADGDRAVRNTAPEGEELIKWLLIVAGQGEDRPCQFRTSRCLGTPCQGAPACGSWMVPGSEVDTGCLESCSSPSWCERVESCKVCEGQDHVCVLDQQGGAHCLPAVYSCAQETVTCQCGGDSLCAGFAAYCHGDTQSGFSCSAP